jgi:hypothetical protein
MPPCNIFIRDNNSETVATEIDPASDLVSSLQRPYLHRVKSENANDPDKDLL